MSVESLLTAMAVLAAVAGGILGLQQIEKMRSPKQKPEVGGDVG